MPRRQRTDWHAQRNRRVQVTAARSKTDFLGIWGAKVDTQVAAPAETRTPNWHWRKIAPKQCGWKDGDRGGDLARKKGASGAFPPEPPTSHCLWPMHLASRSPVKAALRLSAFGLDGARPGPMLLSNRVNQARSSTCRSSQATNSAPTISSPRPESGVSRFFLLCGCLE